MVVCEDIEQSSISFMHIHKAVKLLAVAVKTLGKFPRNLSCDITGIRACVVRKYNSDVSRTWLKVQVILISRLRSGVQCFYSLGAKVEPTFHIPHGLK